MEDCFGIFPVIRSVPDESVVRGRAVLFLERIVDCLEIISDLTISIMARSLGGLSLESTLSVCGSAAFMIGDILGTLSVALDELACTVDLSESVDAKQRLSSFISSVLSGSVSSTSGTVDEEKTVYVFLLASSIPFLRSKQ